MINDTFATRDLVLSLRRRPRYRVITLGERITRLYQGVGDELSEVFQGDFPLSVSTGPDDRGRPPRRDRGMDRTGPAAEHRRHGLRSVDEALEELDAAEPMPLILVGSTRALATFEEVSRSRLPTVATVPLTEDSPSPAQIVKRVAPLIREWTRSEEAAFLRVLEGELMGRPDDQRSPAGVDRSAARPDRLALGGRELPLSREGQSGRQQTDGGRRCRRAGCSRRLHR